MSQLFKLIRCNQILRSSSPLCRTKLIYPEATFSMPRYQMRPSSASSKSPENGDKKVKDDIKYEVRFKNSSIDIRTIFKQFYSLYGPLFVVCHIGVSLASLGFWSGLVWLSVDPVQYVPDFIVLQIGERVSGITAGGGKFVVAYGIHKILLPIRLLASITLTRFLAPKIKLLRK